uniref:Proline-rich transmembrane protein 1-like n=1 Tax=Crassostrea virginica TaxID=6565 RepID=A0A8B8AF45_CRAVI|nr:proline-rich transmembrane protein 1-like [Crassostrea virginica]
MSPENKLPPPPAYSQVAHSSGYEQSNFNQGKQFNQYPSQNLQPPDGAQLGGVIDHTAVPVVTQPGPATFVIQHKDWMCAAIFACLCCFWPTGLAAIRYADRANSAAAAGNIEATRRYSTTARNFVIASVVLGVICIPLIVLERLNRSRYE